MIRGPKPVCGHSLDFTVTITTHLFGSIMELSWKIRNLSLCRKMFEHCNQVQNFPPVPEMLSKIQSDPSPLGYGIFFFIWSQKIRNLSLSRQIFKHCHFVRNFPLDPEMYLQIQSDPFPLGYVIFFKKDLADFLRIFPRIFKGPFLTS